jgi:hypothetical protein
MRAHVIVSAPGPLADLETEAACTYTTIIPIYTLLLMIHYAFTVVLRDFWTSLSLLHV